MFMNKYPNHIRLLQVISFAGMELNYLADTSKLSKSRLMKGQKTVKPLGVTVDLLKEFYKPFNKRLVTLLDDSQWCFSLC